MRCIEYHRMTDGRIHRWNATDARNSICFIKQGTKRVLRRFPSLEGEEAHELADDALNITVNAGHALLELMK